MVADGRSPPGRGTLLGWVVAELARTGSASPVVLGFDASRHRARLDGAVRADYLDLGICEEAAAGIALGLWASGRDVVFDAMFVGFLSRCIEPLTVGLETATYFAGPRVGRLVIRALDAPLPHRELAHEGLFFEALATISTLRVVHAADELDVTWALGVEAFRPCALMLLESPEPDAFRMAEVVTPKADVPARRWPGARAHAEVVLCTNNWAPACRRAFGDGRSLVSVPSPVALPASLPEVLQPFASLDLLGIAPERVEAYLGLRARPRVLDPAEVVANG